MRSPAPGLFRWQPLRVSNQSEVSEGSWHGWPGKPEEGSLRCPEVWAQPSRCPGTSPCRAATCHNCKFGRCKAAGHPYIDPIRHSPAHFKRQSSQPGREHCPGSRCVLSLPCAFCSTSDQIRSTSASLLSTFCCEDITQEGASLQAHGTAKTTATIIIFYTASKAMTHSWPYPYLDMSS